MAILKRRVHVRAWLAVALWTAVVWSLSIDDFSADQTSRFIRPLLSWLFSTLDARSITELHYALRKAAHGIEYGILALLAFRALRIGAPRRTARSVGLALALVATVAVADEGHQARTESRTGTPSDVVVDLVAGLGGLALAGMALRLRARRRAARASLPAAGSRAPQAP